MNNLQTMNSAPRLAPNRRGITLLFVISMIVLFLLMGTTFVVISNDYLKSARRRSHTDLVRDPGKVLLERAFYELVRGPSLNNTASPLRGHSILADLYGYGYKAEVTSATRIAEGIGNDDPTRGQFFDLRLRAPNGGAANNGQSLRDGSISPFSATDAPIEDAYNGLLMTFTTQAAAGATVRIVDYFFDGGDSVFRVMPVWNSDQTAFDPAEYSNNLVGAEVIINGHPFGGTGAGGFTAGSSAALGNACITNPNQQNTSFNSLVSDGTSLPLGYLSSDNSPNEPWDAPDHQNMFLSFGDGSAIPSFFRNYGGGGGFRAFPSQANRGIAVDNDGDGIPDGIWMDIGLPVQTDSSGRYIKPLVSYRVVDLDSRLNVNAAGSLAHTDTSGRGYVTTATNFVSATPVLAQDLVRGQGYGPADISLAPLFEGAATEYQALLNSRYQNFDESETNAVPGGDDLDARTRTKLLGYPNLDVANYGTRGGLFASSAMDLHGRFAIGTPVPIDSVNDYRDPNNPDFPNGLPGIDMETSGLSSVTGRSTELANSPYEMNFAAPPYGDSNDSPFTANELERILRSRDRDAFMLAPRLWDVAPNAFDASGRGNIVTTDSWSLPNLPVAQAGLVQALAQRIADETGLDSVMNYQTAHDMLPREFWAGLPMNVNREFGNGLDDDGDGSIDEAGEANSDGAGQLYGLNSNDKQEFAKQLYVLALLVTNDMVNFTTDVDGDGDSDQMDYRAMLAQWSVNVVDFRDPDSIMTIVEMDLNPFNGWDVDGNVATNETDSYVVRGLERPELLLSEGIVLHDRRTEDESIGGVVGGPTGDEDFDNRLRPNASAFIEVYNPWTQNQFNQRLSQELYDSNQAGVELQKVSSTGSPVWRIAVRRYSLPGDPQGNMLRAIYFTNDYGAITETDTASNVEVFYPSNFVDLAPVSPGQHCVCGTANPDMVIGDQYVTPLGRLETILKADEGSINSLDIAGTRQIGLDPTNGLVTRLEWDGAAMTQSQTEAVVVALDAPRPFNLSDPQLGYPDHQDDSLSSFIGDGYEYTSPYDEPLDATTDRNRTDDDIESIWTNGQTPDFRVVDLQRLADPTQPWNEFTNPYVTIDSMSLNIVAFNGVQNDSTNGNNMSTPDPGHSLSPVLAGNGFFTDLRSYERGYIENDSTAANQKRLLWQSVNAGRRNPPSIETATVGDGHKLSFEFVESLGETNDWFTDANVFDPADPVAFPWLQWNNRPYVSELELANVPLVGPDRLSQQFTIDDGSVTDLYNSILCPFGHLPNFANTDMELYKILDYLHVPSRFTGTEQYLNRNSPSFRNLAPFNFVAQYREPGKININTISSPRVWEGLMSRFHSSNVGDNGIDGGIDFGTYQNLLGVNTTTSPPAPFRPAHAASYRSSLEPAIREVDCGLYREAAGGQPLFDFEPGTQNAYNNSDRSPYFRNQIRERMGNLVSYHSNVFAIWITIGYFEYEPTLLDTTISPVPTTHYAPVDDDPTNDHQSEVGFDLGLIKRSRAFYVFDRSIPMGFEPGKNHNVDRGVLVKSIIEE